MTVDEVDDLLGRLSTGSCPREVAISNILATWRPLVDPRRDAKVLVTVLGAEGGQTAMATLRDQCSNLALIVLGALEHWTALLRPHFEDPQRQPSSTTTLVRRQLADGAPIGTVALWDNEMTWRDHPGVIWALTGLLGALPAGGIVKFEHASKLVPFVVHLAEDCSPVHRASGVLLMQHFLQAVTERITLQMQLDELFFSVKEPFIGNKVDSH